MSGPLMILVAGANRSGTGDDPARIQANFEAMTRTALALYRRGHLPVMGEWVTLPLIEAAEADRESAVFEAILRPVADRLLARCDVSRRFGRPTPLPAGTR